MNPILIHKGDSTTFADVKRFLTFNIATDLDLTGWRAKFILGWITKEIEDISTKSFEIVLSSEDTKQLRLGSQNGSIILTDSEGHIKTVANNIPFEVTTAVVENEYQEIDLTIPQSSGVDILLKVGAQSGAVSSVNGMTGDVIIPEPDLTDYVKNTDYATFHKAGVVKIGMFYGLDVLVSGHLHCIKATDEEIIAKEQHYKPIVPKNLDLAVKTGITTNTLELSEEEKANAKHWLGYADSTDIMQAIASIPQFKLSIVEELPLAGEKMTLYLVPKEGTDKDVYNEYIWIEETASFEHLGTTAVDLTNYVKKTDWVQTGKAGLVRIDGTLYGTGEKSGYIVSPVRTLEQYEVLQDIAFIGKGTLENILTQYSKTVSITQADYEALELKDANTLYLIEE